jgi:lysophospholipase L1-like esterase
MGKNVPVDNRYIYVKGAAYVIRSPDKLFYKRFSDTTINAPDAIRMFPTETARTTSGVSIQFKTKSSFIHLAFSPEKGLSEKGIFGVLRNGSFFKSIPFSAEEAKAGLTLKLDSLPVNEAAVYEVLLPSYSNLALTGIDLADNASLLKYKPSKKKIYISFGDSITHGRGQDGATFLTYPYQLAEKMGMDYFNLAVGSARVSMPIARMSADLPKASVITILTGYNDMNGESKPLAQFEKDYRDYLTVIRQNQPKAKIFCISLLYTKTKMNAKTKATTEDYRTAVENIVSEFKQKDKKLYFIAGETVSSLENLQPGENTDKVHLTVKGANLLADALYRAMRHNL